TRRERRGEPRRSGPGKRKMQRSCGVIPGAGVLSSGPVMRQETLHPRDALLELGPLDGIGETHMFIGTMTAEINTGGERDAPTMQNVAREGLAVVGKPRALGVHEKPAGRHHGNAEAKLPKR